MSSVSSVGIQTYVCIEVFYPVKWVQMFLPYDKSKFKKWWYHNLWFDPALSSVS